MDYATTLVSKSIRHVAILSLATVMAACGGGGEEAPAVSPATAPTTPTTPATNRPPTIAGSPVTAVQVGQAYNFTPTGADPDGNALTYSITNKPTWANFASSTGALTGTPNAGNIGSTTGIVISVSDGTVTVPLTAFNLTVTAATLATVTVNWTAPTSNTDGTQLAAGAVTGYRIYYGSNPSSLVQYVDVSGGGTLSRQIPGLSSGTYYFAMTAWASGEESSRTNLISAVIP